MTDNSIVTQLLWPDDQHRLVTSVNWVIRDLLRQGAVGTCSGLPDSRKSWATLDAAVCIANGREEFLGHRIDSHGPVLVIAADDGAETCIDRLRMISRFRLGHTEYQDIVLLDRGDSVAADQRSHYVEAEYVLGKKVAPPEALEGGCREGKVR